MEEYTCKIAHILNASSFHVVNYTFPAWKTNFAAAASIIQKAERGLHDGTPMWHTKQ